MTKQELMTEINEFITLKHQKHQSVLNQ